jgi:hypothetical protein
MVWAQFASTMFPYCSPLPAAHETKSRVPAIQGEDASYLLLAKEPWGGLCGSTNSESLRTDDILPAKGVVRLTTGWLRHKAADPLPPQPARRQVAPGTSQRARSAGAPNLVRCRYGIVALRAQGLLDEARAYAGVSRGLNIPDSAVVARSAPALGRQTAPPSSIKKMPISASQWRVSSTQTCGESAVLGRAQAGARRVEGMSWFRHAAGFP